MNSALRPAIIITSFAVVLWFCADQLGRYKSGTRPTQTFAEVAGTEDGQAEEYEDPTILRLRAAAAAAPKDAATWQALADELRKHLDGSPGVQSKAAIELVEVLKTISELKPNDIKPILEIADLSFNLMAFTKAVSYYEIYLKKKPNDAPVRARYASALIFVNESDKAIAELKAILKKEPKNFHALAYLAIAYAQLGDSKQAESVGKKAVAAAPTEEARTRVETFLASLNSSGKDSSEVRPAGQDDAVKVVSNYLSSNPIAGPKFKGSKVQDQTTLVVMFADFPMQAMPPFAKEKFLGGLKAELTAKNVTLFKEIRFVDTASGEVMETLVVP